MRDPRSRSGSSAVLALALLAGSTVAATGQEEERAPQPPVEFTGRACGGPPVSPDRSGSEEAVEIGYEGMVLTRSRGGAWRQSGTVSDPRLEGDWYHTYEADRYTLPNGESGPYVAAWTFRIENAEGAWVSRGVGLGFPDGTESNTTAEVLVGEGAYEGLYAVMVTEANDSSCGEWRGIIFDGIPRGEPYIPD